MNKKTAKYLRTMLSWRGDARVYQLSEPLEEYGLVIVSAVTTPYSGPETFIFGATEESLERNDAAYWGELHGSFSGGLDHAEALRRAGYQIDE